VPRRFLENVEVLGAVPRAQVGEIATEGALGGFERLFAFGETHQLAVGALGGFHLNGI
jgi:hypothetical protein